MRLVLMLSLAAVTGTLWCDAPRADEPESALDFQVQSIDGQAVDLEQYQGNVVLIVNTASKCGLTPQYAGLQKMYQQYRKRGFVVLGFPCNQFAGQEPGSNAEIQRFCTTEYDVSFPMFSKIEVNGDGAAPLYQYLTAQEVEPAGQGAISWNFEKFLVDRDGRLVHRFTPRTKPSDAELVRAVEQELGRDES